MEKTNSQENLRKVVDCLSIEQKNKLLSLSKEQRKEIFTILKKEQEERGKMQGDRHLLIEDLQRNHVSIKEGVKKCGYLGKVVHVDLPAVGWFNGFKFDYFMSDNNFDHDVSRDGLVSDECFLAKELRLFVQAVNEYMRANGVKVEDGSGSYHNCSFVKELLGWFDGADKNYEDGSKYCSTVYPLGNGDCMCNVDGDDYCDFGNVLQGEYKLLLRP